MDINAIIDLVKNFGVPGIVFILWHYTTRAHEKTLRQYQLDMIEQREMYEANVNLVKQYAGLAQDLKDIVIMNTQAWQQGYDAINSNQFCPRVRLEKQAKGVER